MAQAELCVSTVCPRTPAREVLSLNVCKDLELAATAKIQALGERRPFTLQRQSGMGCANICSKTHLCMLGRMYQHQGCLKA